MVEKVRERLSVSKRVAQDIDMERFNLKNLNEVEAEGQYLYSQIGLQLCETLIIMRISVELRKLG
jgi:hypothetical protein